MDYAALGVLVAAGIALVRLIRRRQESERLARIGRLLAVGGRLEILRARRLARGVKA
jgi:hypothetical protein